MSKQRVVITGAGIVSCIGNDLASVIAMHWVARKAAAAFCSDWIGRVPTLSSSQ